MSNQNSCIRGDPVTHTFNYMYSNFTDYRANNDMNIEVSQIVASYCGSNANVSANNAYDNKLCLQRNTGTIINNIRDEMKKKYILRLC